MFSMKESNKAKEEKEMNKEMMMARIRLVGNMNNYELKQVMLKEIEREIGSQESQDLQRLMLNVKQEMLEKRFDELDRAFDRMKEENVGNTYRAAMRSIVDEIHEVRAERFQVLEKRAGIETGLNAIGVLGNLTRCYDSNEMEKESKEAFLKAVDVVQALNGEERQAGWRTLMDPIAGDTNCMERLLPYAGEMKGNTLRELYVGLISSAARDDDVELAFKRTMQAAEALKDEEAKDIYFVFLWETLNFLKQMGHPKKMAKPLWEVILKTADELNHVPAVAKMHVFLANAAMGESDYSEARVHLDSLEGIVDAYGYELLFEEHAEMIRNAMAHMRRDLPKASERSPLRLVEITPEEMKQFSMIEMPRN